MAAEVRTLLEYATAAPDQIREGFTWDHVRVPREIVEDTNIGAYEKALYLVLALHADWQSGQCFPSIKRLAQLMGASESTVKRSIHNLVKAGYLEKETRQGTGKDGGPLNLPNLYILRRKSEGGFTQNPGPHRTQPGFTQNPGVGSHRATNVTNSNLTNERESAPARKTSHNSYFGRIVNLWGKYANDLEKGAYEKAAKNFAQAEATLQEMGELKEEFERRWPHLGASTPMAVAKNISTLRAPAPEPERRNGRRAEATPPTYAELKASGALD